MKKVIVNIFLLLFFCVSFGNVKADSTSIINGSDSAGNNSLCTSSSGYIACYLPKYQFRATLVDANGNKVEGTHSVDFANNRDLTDNSIKVTSVNDRSIGKSEYKTLHENYWYKYGIDDLKDKFTYIELLLDSDSSHVSSETGRDDPTYYNEFYTSFVKTISEKTSEGYRIKNYSISIGENNFKTDFLTLFAIYSGYVKPGEVCKDSECNIDSSDEKVKKIADNHYYLLLEPTYQIYYNTYNTLGKNSYYYRYGTSSEIMDWILTKITDTEETPKAGKDAYAEGFLRGLSVNFIYQASCNMYTKPESAEAIGFSGITEYVDCSSGDLYSFSTTTFPTYEKRPGIISSVNETNNGNGVAVLKLENIIKPKDDTEEYYTSIVDLCDGNSLTFNPIYGGGSLNASQIQDEAFLVAGNAEENSAVYCYDTVSYDFNNLFKNLINDKTYYTTIDWPITVLKKEDSGLNIIINRSCYFKSNIDLKFAKNFSSYEEKDIVLNAFGSDYDLEYVSSNEVEVKDNRGLHGSGFVTLKYNLTYKLQNPIVLTNGTYSDASYKGYIYFKGDNKSLFGSEIYSNKTTNFVTNLFNEKPLIIDKTTYNLKELKSSNADDNDGIKCKFNLEFKNNTMTTIPTDDPENTPIQELEETSVSNILQFRTISLSNPFPARDGTSRLPGTNWLNTENNVYNYITNNRSVQYLYTKIKSSNEFGISAGSIKDGTELDPNLMYLVTEPMYTIVLDASTMTKIRNYNKSNDYSEINSKLECNEDGRECISSFLRSDVISSDNFSGVCSDITNIHAKTGEFDGKDASEIREKVYEEYETLYTQRNSYDANYDLNKNNRNDPEDLEVYYNRDKQTNFYGCASKTFKSGGPQ